MKTILISTSQFTYYERVKLNECLGILSLAAALEQKGLNYELVDFEKSSPLAPDLFSFTISKSVKTIYKKKPEILAISTMTSNLIFAIEICRQIKKISPQIITIIGGPGGTGCAKEIVERFAFIDIVFKGEADFAFPILINSIIVKNWEKIKKIQGVVSKISGEIFENEQASAVESLDTLGFFPRINCKNVEKFIYIEIGRGCPFRCTYCSTSSFFSRKYRCKSVDRIINEICHYENKISTSKKRIIFYHDLLTFSRSYVERLCEQIREKLPNVRWSCSSRLDFLDIELLDKMHHGGCDRIFIGIEAPNTKMQKSIQKNLDLNKLLPVLNKMSEFSMEVTLSFITGFHDQDEEDSLALINSLFKYKYLNNSFYKSRKRMIQIHLLHLNRGTILYEQYKNLMSIDSVGNPGTSELPVPLSEHHEIILKNPDIFCCYYHIAGTSVKRKYHLMMSFLAIVTNHELQYSFFIAFLFLQQNLAKLLWEAVDDIELPTDLSQRSKNLLPFLSSLEIVITRGLKNEVVELCQALFTYEKFTYIAKNNEGSKDDLFFTSTYDIPLLIFSLQKNKCSTFAELEKFRIRTRSYFVYTEHKKVRIAHVPNELFSLAQTALVDD